MLRRVCNLQIVHELQYKYNRRREPDLLNFHRLTQSYAKFVNAVGRSQTEFRYYYNIL